MSGSPVGFDGVKRSGRFETEVSGDSWELRRGRTFNAFGSVRYWSIGGNAGVPLPEGATDGVLDMSENQKMVDGR